MKGLMIIPVFVLSSILFVIFSLNFLLSPDVVSKNISKEYVGVNSFHRIEKLKIQSSSLLKTEHLKTPKLKSKASD